MRKLGLIAGLCLITMFACDNSQPQTDEEFIATHKDALGVFTTTTGVLTMPAGQLPANLSFEKVRAFYPVVCLDLDSDHDGIPDSFDLHFNGNPSSINPSALPHPCKRCNRGPGVNGDFRLHVMGTNVDLQRGRVSAMGANVLTIPGPDGAITVNWTSATEIKDGPVSPGAEVRVRGTMTATNTIAADLIWVLCPGATMNGGGTGGGAGGGTGSTGGATGNTGGGTGSTGGGAGSTGGGSGTGGGFIESGGGNGSSAGGGSAMGTGGGTTNGAGGGSTGGGDLGGGTGTPSDPNLGGSPGVWTPVVTPSGQLDPTQIPTWLQPMPTVDQPGTPPMLN